MLEGGQQVYNGSQPAFLKWESEAERRVYLGGAGVALVVLGVALGLGLLIGPEVALPTVLAQFVAGLLVFGFTVGGDLLSRQGRLTPAAWEVGAFVCAGVVFVTSLFVGEYFNIMLTPLLVGFAHRRNDQRTVVLAGVGVVIVVGLELVLSYSLGWQRQSAGGAGTSLAAMAALTLSLTTFMGRYRREVNDYREEAANKASEMEVAHEIQTSLMPPNQFTSGNWTLAARSLPAKDVGGDFYEYVSHPHIDRMISGIAIGDVAGKGIPAALQMAVVRTLFRVEARRRIFPGETLMSVNMALQAERSFGMVTMLYAFLDINRNTLHLANAGHNYPLVLNNGTLEEIKMPGLPLGIDDGIEYEEKIISITPGTSVIFYTDGVVEAMDKTGELYTFERLKESILANHQLGPVEMVDKILAEISVFTDVAAQSDDITVLVLQYHPQAAELETLRPEPPVSVLAESVTGRRMELEVDEDGVNWI